MSYYNKKSDVVVFLTDFLIKYNCVGNSQMAELKIAF